MTSTPEQKLKKAEYQRKWRAKNTERSYELVKAAKAKNPEKYKEIERAKYLRWKLDKPQELKAIQKKAREKFYLKKPWLVYNVTRAEEIRLWKKANPENMKLIRKRAKAKRRNIEGSYSLQEWRELKATYNFTCPSCLRKEPEVELHADHVMPVVKGGSNYISNIQPLCKVCNSRKFTKTIRYDIPETVYIFRKLSPELLAST